MESKATSLLVNQTSIEVDCIFLLFLLDFSSNFTNTESPYAMEEKNSGEKMEGETLITRRIGQTKVEEKGGKQRKKS